MKEGSAMTEILAIDDDREILAVIKKALLREGYQVTALEDPLQLEEDKLGRYQLILLDVMMPGIDGFDLCRRIREKVDCPILFLTAKTEEKDVMTGLGAGGDDYITKPFGIGELRARVAAHIRRENREKTHTICIGEVRFSMQERKIYVQEHELVFTKAEYTICEFLALNHGQVFSKECILEHVFGFDGDSNSSAITEHVKISVQNSRNSGLTRLKRFGGSAIDGNEKKKTKNTDRAVFEICGVILSGYVRNRNVLSGVSSIKSHDRIYAACQLCGAATDGPYGRN